MIQFLSLIVSQLILIREKKFNVSKMLGEKTNKESEKKKGTIESLEKH